MNEQEELQDSILRVINTSSGPKVNSIITPLVYTGQLYLAGNMYITGAVETPLRLNAGIIGLSFANGSAASPSLYFTGDATSGYYLAAPGLLGIASGGNGVAGFGPTGLTSISGDLVLNSASSNIDCSGKNLINVGGFSANPNYYDVVAPAQVLTTNNTPTDILIIPTTLNAAYTIIATVTAAAVNGDNGSYSVTISARNFGGVVTVDVPFNIDKSVQGSLAPTSIHYSVSGQNITVAAVGINLNIKWLAAAKISRSLY